MVPYSQISLSEHVAVVSCYHNGHSFDSVMNHNALIENCFRAFSMQFIGRNTLSNIANGNLSPEKFTMPLLIAICKIFNCDIGYLLGEYDENTRKEKVIQEELHLSSKAISTLKEIKCQSITQNPTNPFTERKKHRHKTKHYIIVY